MSSEQDMTTGTAETPVQQPPPKRGRGLSQRWFTFIGAIILLNIVAVILIPPFPKGGSAGEAVSLPGLLHQRHAGVPGTRDHPAADRCAAARRP